MKLLQRRLLLWDVIGMQTIQVKSDIFTLLLLLIAAGSVQINVASMKTEDESKINRFYKQKFQIIFVFPTIQTSSQNH